MAKPDVPGDMQDGSLTPGVRNGDRNRVCPFRHAHAGTRNIPWKALTKYSLRGIIRNEVGRRVHERIRVMVGFPVADRIYDEHLQALGGGGGKGNEENSDLALS